MKDKIKSLFLSNKGKRIKESIIDAINDYKMASMIESGVLVGFSGGADSVILLSFLAYYSEWCKKFPVVAVHIDHSIRGEESDRDAKFSKRFCEELGIEFYCRKIDIPRLAAESKKGIEECARDYRYSEFRNIISGRNDISTICVAHNADDNLETLLMNLFRGAGAKGLAGIPPIRDNIARPLLYVRKEDIVSALNESEIEFVFDSTNLCNDYKRNRIRNELLPKIREISSQPEIMASRASKNLRLDDEYITSVAADFLKSRDCVRNHELNVLHEAVFIRVLQIFTNVSLSSVNAREIKKLLSEDNFSYSLPEGRRFVAEYGVCRVVDDKTRASCDFTTKLTIGCNFFDEYDSDVVLSPTKMDDSFLNIYKFSIQVNLSSAIISGDLYLRPKKDGDTIKYGNITHKLKKLFNDRKIPPTLRPFIPVICDDKGVVCVPGFGVRDDNVDKCDRKDLYLSLCIGKGEEFKNNRFYCGNEFNK